MPEAKPSVMALLRAAAREGSTNRKKKANALESRKLGSKTELRIGGPSDPRSGNARTER